MNDMNDRRKNDRSGFEPGEGPQQATEPNSAGFGPSDEQAASAFQACPASEDIGASQSRPGYETPREEQDAVSTAPPSSPSRPCFLFRPIRWAWGLLTRPTRLGEILRFCVVGGIATLIDFAVMALLLWLFEPEAYPTFWDLFTGDPSPLISAIASAAGFLTGHIFNYSASVLFVFYDNARGRTKRGFVVFTLIALFCLLLHAIGMYACRALLDLNEWLIKTLLTILVTALSYVLKKKFLF